MIIKMNADNLPPDFREVNLNLDYSISYSLPEIIREKFIEVEDSVGGCGLVVKTKNQDYLLKCTGKNNFAIVVKYNNNFDPVFLTKITYYDSIRGKQGDGDNIQIKTISEIDTAYLIMGDISGNNYLHIDNIDKGTGNIKNQYYSFQQSNTFTPFPGNSLLSPNSKNIINLGYHTWGVNGTDINIMPYIKSFTTNGKFLKENVFDSLNAFDEWPFLIYDTTNNIFDGVIICSATSQDPTFQGISHVRFDDNLNISVNQRIPFNKAYYPIKYTNFDNNLVLWGYYEPENYISSNLDILEFNDRNDFSNFTTHHVEFKYLTWVGDIIKSKDGGYLIPAEIDFLNDSLYHIHGNSDNALIKLNKDFKIEWERYWGSSDIESLTWCEELDNGNIYVVGGYMAGDTNGITARKIYFAEIKSPSSGVDNGHVNNNQTEIIFPSIVSSTSPELKINSIGNINGEIFVRDLFGRCLQSINISLTNNTNYLSLNFSNMATGVYFIELKTRNGIEVKKFILEP
jgi:hypothetical protein